jgi:NADPH:quinone reductase
VNSKTMKAMVNAQSGEKRVLEWREDLPVPEPGATELIVKIHATSVNFVDLQRATSHFEGKGANAPSIAGLEFAGTVAEVGTLVRDFQVGDRVMALAAGGYAEYACVDQQLAVLVPERMSWAEAGATMVTFMTAHDALCIQAELRPGDNVLVQACTSGVGIAAVQIAKYLHAFVIGTSTNSTKLAEMTASYGMDGGINVREKAVPATVMQLTNERGADVIIDNVGASALSDNLAGAAIRARWVDVGRLGGAKGELDLNEFARKRLRLIGVTFRTRSFGERAEVVRRFNSEILPAMAAGAIRPKIDRVFTLREAGEAQDYMKKKAHFGKIVLTIE